MLVGLLFPTLQFLCDLIINQESENKRTADYIANSARNKESEKIVEKVRTMCHNYVSHFARADYHMGKIPQSDKIDHVRGAPNAHFWAIH